MRALHPVLETEAHSWVLRGAEGTKSVQSLEEFGVRGARWSETKGLTTAATWSQRTSSWRQRLRYTILRSGGDATGVLGQVGVGHWPGAKGQQSRLLLRVLAPGPGSPSSHRLAHFCAGPRAQGPDRRAGSVTVRFLCCPRLTDRPWRTIAESPRSRAG